MSTIAYALRKIFKGLIKLFLLLIFVYALIALFVNVYVYFGLISKRQSFKEGWYHYQTASISSDQDIYPNLIASIKPNDNVYISMFLWPLDELPSRIVPPYDVDLASFLNANTKCVVYIDSINFKYKPSPEKIAVNPVMQASPKVAWHILWQPYALPNNIIMWFIHTPWLQKYIVDHTPNSIRGSYAGAKISSNHQKIVVINNADGGIWIGSRNFNRLNWNNQDQLLFMTGDIAKVVYDVAQNTIARLNDGFKTIETAIKPNTIDNAAKIDHLARIVSPSELKPILLDLMSQSSHVDAAISLLSENDIIYALNKVVQNQGEVRILLDPNRYIFRFKLPFMPNVVPISDLDPKVQVRVQQTEFQMHTKSALFTLRNGAICYYNGTANWSTGALDRLAFNDIAILICNDPIIIQQYNDNFSKNWNNALPREKIIIEDKFNKYWLTQIMSWSGINPW